jgi:hypothetical protein
VLIAALFRGLLAKVSDGSRGLHRDEEVTVWVPQSMFDAQPAAAGH